MPKKYCSTEHIYFFKSNGAKEKWCRHQELNSGPDDYKSTALPTELYRQRSKFYINKLNVGSCKIVAVITLIICV